MSVVRSLVVLTLVLFGPTGAGRFRDYRVPTGLGGRGSGGGR